MLCLKVALVLMGLASSPHHQDEVGERRTLAHSHPPHGRILPLAPRSLPTLLVPPGHSLVRSARILPALDKDMFRLSFLVLLAVATTLVLVVEARLDMGVCSPQKPCTKEKSYCHYPDGQCGKGLGICDSLAEVCTKEYMPVCGCDGNTYGNPCMAAAVGVSLLGQGKCMNDTDAGSCLSDDDCSDAESFCKRNLGECGGKGTCSGKPQFCPMMYSPVCGCDGKTYSNECHAASTGVSVSAAGECGVTDTQKRSEAPCSADADCADSQFCKRRSGACSGAGTCSAKPELCPMSYVPVCGCDGRTYSNACRAGQRGMSIKSPGEC